MILHIKQKGPSKQKKQVCKSCPWLKESLDRGHYFHPAVLAETIVADDRAGRIHSCHSSREHFCTGYLAFKINNGDDRLISNQLLRLAQMLNILDPDKVPIVATFLNVDDMMNHHRSHLAFDLFKKRLFLFRLNRCLIQ